MIDASRFPGPAIWMGIMLIVGAVLAVFMFSTPSQKNANRATAALAAFGIALFACIIYFVR